MTHRGKGRFKLPAALAVAGVLCAFALVGCDAAPAYEGLPQDHVETSTSKIEFNQQRCGACHDGAHRGSGSFVLDDGLGGIDVWNIDRIADEDMRKGEWA